MLIPKLIHMTTKSRRHLTEPFIANLERMRNLNPDWTISVYEDEECLEFIRMYFDTDMLHTYRAINPRYGAARADLFRYLLLYQCGGAYLDIKSAATRPLDDVLKPADQYLLAHWDNAPGRPFQGWGVHAETPYPGEFVNWCIVAGPRHTFLEHVAGAVQRNIRSYDPSRDGTGKRAVLRMTGPIAYTKAITPLLGSAPARVIDIDKLGFIYSFFDPDNAIFRRTGRLAHEALMPDHYRGIAEPLVLK